MGIRVKLGQYKADEEDPPYSLLSARLAVIVGIAFLLSLVVVFVVTSIQSRPKVQLVRAGSSFPSGGPSAAGPSSRAYRHPDFLEVNWEHLERRPVRPPPESLDTDLDCPEWEGKEVYKELKAMAVYELRTPRTRERTRPELIERLFEGKR